MALANGSQIGSYEILAPIGAGGMGEVYRARDSKLGRNVALKVLPDAFARDAERMARFQREAKVLASLNHPNIAAIYGFEDSGATRALVMELVEGPTLADRIHAGPIPMDEALRVAKQITEALEYAHERGIVHRELKPGNVKVTNDDAVKVLDFGLAKAIEGDAASADIATSPTVSRMATMAGVLLGTAAYMSPEQAKAKSVDRRADIWAFGCVLYEMLTGKMTFHGDAVTDTLAAVIKDEPDWSQLAEAPPVRIRVLLKRCLQKDPKQRLRDIGDARISLDEVLSGAPLEAAPGTPMAAQASRRQIVVWCVASMIVASLTGLAAWRLKPVPSAPPRPVMRTVIDLPTGDQLTALDYPAAVISPDGTQLAYVAAHSGSRQIYLRALDSLEARPVPGTEGAVSPFFSPDGQWLGFFSGSNMKKISLSGGVPLKLSIANASNSFGASWGGQGMIVFARNVGALSQVSDAGGESRPVTQLAIEKGETMHSWPDVLPGGEAVLFTVGPSRPHIAVRSLRSGEQRDLALDGTLPRYAASGNLLYVQGGNLMAAGFDPRRLQLTGAAVPVVQGVLQLASGAAQYSVSATGSLVYVPGTEQGAARRLVWVSRNGTEQPLPAPPRNYVYPRLSPDGRRVALGIREQGSQVWLYDYRRDALTRLTFGGNGNDNPTWTPDGKRLAYVGSQESPPNIVWQLADGSGGVDRLTTEPYASVPSAFSSDGQLLTFVEIDPTSGYDVWVLRLSDGKAQPFLRTPGYESAPRFSTDGHWLAYVSDESGRFEIYVQPYPGPGGKYQISTDGGTEPVWNPKGKELFYRSGNKMMAVDITTQPGFSVGKPKMLFQGPYVPTLGTLPFYDVSPDGERFLMLKPTEQTASLTQIVVVQNWFEELKRLAPSGK